MKKRMVLPMAVFSIFPLSVPVLADTTVTVDDDKVVVDRDRSETTTVVQQTAPQTIVVQKVPVVVTRPKDPRELEGEIIRVDYPGSRIVVWDIDGRERKVLLKQGMIGTYKVGDYVQIYLMTDLREAKTIHTRRTADLEGDIVTTDYTRSQIVVHELGGVDRVVILSPGMNSGYKAGDHVRLYVVSDYPDVKEVRLIRVK